MCFGYHDPTPPDVPNLIRRRGFLKASASALLLGAAGSLRGGTPALAADASGAACLPEEARGKVPVAGIGIQLYTLRQLMDADLDAVLAELARIGYRNVEHAGFHGRDARAFKAALDAHGLQAVSGHQSPPYPYRELDWRRIIDDAYILGQKRMVEPLPLFALPGIFAPQANVPSAVWGNYAQDLNKAAAQAAIYGIEVGYHNHAAEFAPLADAPGRTGYDVLMAETDPALVHFELDIYWAWVGQHDPVELLAQYGHRIRQFHVKDMAEDGSITAPGKGIIDFGRIFAAAEDACLDVRDYLIEQDNAGQGALESAKLGYDLLRAIRY